MPFGSPKHSLALALAALALAAHGAPPALSLEQAQQQALARSRALPALDASVSAAHDLATAAGRLPEPVLKAGVDNLPVSGAERWRIGGEPMTMRHIGVMQEFTRGDKRRLRAALYTGGADKARAEKAMTAARIEREVALAWLDLYYAAMQAALVDEQVRQADLEVTATDAAYRAGRVQQAEVYAARNAAAMLRDRASSLESKRASARTMLERWIGPGSAPELAGLPDMDKLRLDPQALPAQLAHHPEILALAAQEDIARTEVRLAAAERSPDWSLEVAFKQRGSGYGNMLAVEVSVPLQWDRGNKQERVLAARMAQAEQAGDEREEALREHIAQTRAMVDEWRSGRERLKRFRDEIVPLAQARSTAALAAYRGMKLSLGEAIAARTGELDVRLQQVALEQETARLWARLNFLYPTSAKEQP